MSEDRQTIQAHPGRQPAIVYHPAGAIHVYELTEETLDQLTESGLKGLNANFATGLFGALVTLLALFLTGTFRGPTASASAVAAAIVVGVLFLYFAVRAIADHRRNNRLVTRVKMGQ